MVLTENLCLCADMCFLRGCWWELLFGLPLSMMNIGWTLYILYNLLHDLVCSLYTLVPLLILVTISWEVSSRTLYTFIGSTTIRWTMTVSLAIVALSTNFFPDHFLFVYFKITAVIAFAELLICFGRYENGFHIKLSFFEIKHFLHCYDFNSLGY